MQRGRCGVPMAVLPPLCCFVTVLVQLLHIVPCQALSKWHQFSAELDLVRLSTGGLKLPTVDIAGDRLRRSDFPEGFIFGTSTSAYQVEGAAYEGGKGISIWDTYAHTEGNILDGSNGDIAVDEYHRYEEDINLIVDMNMDAYRFSVAWTRIFPNGTGVEPNKEGVAYYNRMIDALLRKGIKPIIALYHWDLPQSLQDAYSGWLSPQIIPAFAAYAEVCFAAFGDRVKSWITFIEPGEFVQGYGGTGGVPIYPPGPYTSPGTSPYIAAHHVLLAHATAVSIYRQKFQAEQGGTVGIAVDCTWGEPMTTAAADREAAERDRQFQVGWWLDPIFFGDYPAAMKKIVGSRLPQFAEDEKSLLKGSADFMGLNHYTSRWVSDATWQCPSPNKESNLYEDRCTVTTTMKDGLEIGPMAASDWLYEVPWGMHRLLLWAYARYNMPIFVSENGVDDDSRSTMKVSVHDSFRIKYYQDYMAYVLQAIRDGVDIRGYFAWSLLDNFEWHDGNNYRFGLTFVDYAHNLTRYPKDSARWFSHILSNQQPLDL